MRALVTGGAGLVGGAIVRALRASGNDVVVGSRNAEFILDLSHPVRAHRDLLERGPFDAVVHAAAALDRAPDSVSMSVVNAGGTHAVIAAAEAWGAAFVYVSGVTVIGRPTTIPIREDHPVRPPDPYIASKLYGEHLVSGAIERGMIAASLRVTAPIGSGMPERRILTAFIAQAQQGAPLQILGQGTRRQDYVDVADVARAVEAWLRSPEPGTFNVGSGRSISNLALGRLVVETVGSSSEVRFGARPDPDDRVHWDVSIDRARKAFGYEPSVPLAESIQAIAAFAS